MLRTLEAEPHLDRAPASVRRTMEPPLSITCLQPIPRLTPTRLLVVALQMAIDLPPFCSPSPPREVASRAESLLDGRACSGRARRYPARRCSNGPPREFGAVFSRKIGLLGPSSCNARSKRAFLRLLSICKAGLVRKDCTKLTVTLQKYPHRLLQPSFLIFKARHVALAIPLRCQTCLRGRRGAEIGPRSRHAAAAPGLRLAGLRPGTGGAGSGASSWQT